MRISDWSSDVCSSDLVVVGYHIAIGRDDEARAKRRRLTGDRLSAAPELAEKLVKRRAGRDAGKAVHLYFLRVGYVHNRRSVARRVGKESVSTCRSRWHPNT